MSPYDFDLFSKLKGPLRGCQFHVFSSVRGAVGCSDADIHNQHLVNGLQRPPVLWQKNPAVYLQVDDHVHPGNCLAAVSSEKKTRPSSYGVLPSPAELGWDLNEQMSYFSSFSDEWSRDLKSIQVLKQLSCRVRDLDESPDPSMSKIVLRNLIISSKYYKEEEAKELLEVITAERLETEQRQKLEQQE
ncbi:hypothetical protein TNCV_3255351 [Trichonephila clavipes]|nr:hypothetical protein TNCV_3255351 [Trichonephila clavipes]